MLLRPTIYTHDVRISTHCFAYFICRTVKDRAAVGERPTRPLHVSIAPRIGFVPCYLARKSHDCHFVVSK